MDSVLVVMLLAYHFGYDKHGDREILDLQLVTQARPNQPLRGSLSVSRKCAGVGWVWLVRLLLRGSPKLCATRYTFSEAKICCTAL